MDLLRYHDEVRADMRWQRLLQGPIEPLQKAVRGLSPFPLAQACPGMQLLPNAADAGGISDFDGHRSDIIGEHCWKAACAIPAARPAIGHMALSRAASRQLRSAHCSFRTAPSAEKPAPGAGQ